MLIIFVNVIYVLAAISMIVLILLQRGAGAAAGSGFGGGASATVFGARGSANFLSKATKWLALVFFTISLGLAINASHPHSAAAAQATPDLGVMGKVPAAAGAPAQSPHSPAVPAPAVPTPAVTLPTQNAPANKAPAIPSPQPAVPAPNAGNAAKPGNKGG